jgi:hypothetical protein
MASNSILRKTALLAGLFLFAFQISRSQPSRTGEYVPGFALRHSGDWMTDKNFYQVTIFSRDKDFMRLLQQEPALAAILDKQKEAISRHATDTCKTAACLLQDFKWTPADSLSLLNAMSHLYAQSGAGIDSLINKQLRPSGCYQRFSIMSNQNFFLQIWGEFIAGTNTIIDHYGLGANFRSPAIDSASYNVKGDYYQAFLKIFFVYLKEQAPDYKVFFQPTLNISLQLLKANERQDPANFEPLEKGENKLALERVKKIGWYKYPYAALLVPGRGPEIPNLALDPMGRLRCDLAAARFHKKQAPFIIVSGGNVHPFHTSYSEALEMKKYLVKVDSVPEAAVIIEPQARHTTTNFRNACRLLYRYGIPTDKPALSVSTRDQTDYIAGQVFDQRNMKDLGYLPFRDKQRLSDHEVKFFPVKDCLQIDPRDPLDP